MSFQANPNSVTRFTGDTLLPSSFDTVFSFFNCTPVPPGPHFSVSSDQSVLSDQSDYTLIAEAARDFCGCLTVTADVVIRNAVRAFRRVICEVKALFNRRVFIFEGGLRL